MKNILGERALDLEFDYKNILNLQRKYELLDKSIV